MITALNEVSPGNIANRSTDESPCPIAVASDTVITAVAGMAAAWVAAGATGLLGHPLRHALTWTALAIAVLASPPDLRRSWLRAVAVLVGIVAAVAMMMSPLPVVNVLAVGAVLGILGASRSGGARSVLRVTATAVAILGLYVLARTSIPWLWLAADRFAGMIGSLAGRLAAEPLRLGATFAGLDFLILMAALYVGWLKSTPPPRGMRAVYGAGAILGGHLLYLLLLAAASRVAAALPAPVPPESAPWWAGVVRQLVPWNMPALGAAIQLLIAAAIFRWSAWPADPAEFAKTQPSPASEARRTTRAGTLVATALAVILPMLTTFWPNASGLHGKKIVAYEKGFLNWLKAEHGSYGRLSVGMYGMLPTYVESLGGRCVISPDLSENDLRDANVLIILFPNEPWAEGQLERIWNFARGGGTVLVFGEHTIRETDGGSRFNDVLAPTAMRIPFDTAVFQIGGWLQSYEPLAHPTTAGVPDDRNQFGVVIGASVEARLPARPLLVGRWGFAEPGDAGSDRAMMGNERYEPGEKLGDVLLAAEQPIGAGRIIAFGDTSGMTNGITPGSYVFTSRLLAYAASDGSVAQTTWRQLSGLLVCLLLVALLIRQPSGARVAVVAVAMAVSLTLCIRGAVRAGEVLPDGRGKTPNNLAYIDSSHLEAYSEESWREDGVGGLTLTLMRSGYLTLSLPELSPERLERAGLLVSVAPGRPFTPAERRTVRRFVEDGGIFICTVGYEACEPSWSLLSEFGFHVGGPACRPNDAASAPNPMGHFKAPYVNLGSYMAYVRFHAAWPVTCTAPDTQVMAYGPEDLPVIIARRVGRGKFVLIGDTCFAMNKNLEREGGEPFEGMRENADFWRWLLTYLTDQPRWTPPKPEIATTPEDAAEPGDQSDSEVTP